MPLEKETSENRADRISRYDAAAIVKALTSLRAELTDPNLAADAQKVLSLVLRNSDVQKRLREAAEVEAGVGWGLEKKDKPVIGALCMLALDRNVLGSVAVNAKQILKIGLDGLENTLDAKLPSKIAEETNRLLAQSTPKPIPRGKSPDLDEEQKVRAELGRDNRYIKSYEPQQPPPTQKAQGVSDVESFLAVLPDLDARNPRRVIASR